ncbi:GNAT family N-acetyltransferase [Radiobacillus kanasensis]|uniref:GNAT family N-acetyltransferase n=1 Tax=Radiobacillus kanasensis TaxID=2844358 RepID=UPI001E2F32F5|nr:GNAT family N-acetyltransferase [Radiobacillus kanasensis]UFU01212.1 GNAT family N-acetyltransferase [Radiobacillus kanasensis]
MIVKANMEEEQFCINQSIQSFSEGLDRSMTVTKEKADKLVHNVMEKGGFYLVYKDEGSILGWVLLGKNKDYFTEITHGFIYDLFVFPAGRGKGISKELLKASIQSFKDSGFDSVRLNVFASNFAKKIYEKFGFEELQTIMEYKIHE